MFKIVKSWDFLAVVIFSQFAVYITVFFNIAVARQAVGFVYFTFVPGFIILKLLRMDELDWAECLLLSVGFSVAFLMIAGLLLDQFGLLFGLSMPLSLVPLMIVFNSLILIGGILVSVRGGSIRDWTNKIRVEHPLGSVSAVLPILSIAGALCVNVFGNNLLLLLMMVSISLVFIVSVVSRRISSSYLYPLAITMISISLLFHSSLMSNYILPFGSDVPLEYFVARTTQTNGYWTAVNPFFGDLNYGRLNSMLSVSILPTIYSNVLNIDLTWVFKALFPLLFSMVPLGLYQIWQMYFQKKYAFIAAFLFVAQSTFFNEMLGLNRQILAELFLVLLMLVLLKRGVKPVDQITCFAVFSIGLVTSHYGLAEIFVFFYFVALFSLIIMKRPSRNITVFKAIFPLVLMFSWYIFTSGSAAFNSILTFGSYVYGQLGEFFNPASRGQAVLLGIGAEAIPSVWNAVSRAFAYVTEASIIVGFIALLSKRTRFRIEHEFLVFTPISMVFLALLILVPGLANTLNISRFYHILLFFLAPLFVIGGQFLAKLVSKRREELLASVLMICLLVPFFLFQTGFVYEVVRSDSWSIPLSGYRMDPLRLYGHFKYIDSFDVSGAQWLSEYSITNSTLFADRASIFSTLVSYGMVFTGHIHELSNITFMENDATVYLGTLNVVYNTITSSTISFNTSDVSSLKNLNQLYSSGGAEILRQHT